VPNEAKCSDDRYLVNLPVYGSSYTRTFLQIA
jgi:hypothetical protein